MKKYLPPLEPTYIKLLSYTEHSIHILGSTQLNVAFKNNVFSLPVLIVKQGSINLSARNWIYPLKLMSVFNDLDPNKDCQNAPSYNLVRVSFKCPKMSVQTLE